MSKKDLEGLNGLSNSVNDLRERLKNDFYGQNENRNSSSDRWNNKKGAAFAAPLYFKYLVFIILQT